MRPGSKAEMVFGVLKGLPVGKSVFTFSKDGRVTTFYTLTHERFINEDGTLNTTDPGDLEWIKHLDYWMQPTEAEMADLVSRAQVAAGIEVEITQKSPGISRMTRIKRVK